MSQKNIPEVSIVILNYNAGDLLVNCLNSIFNTTFSNFEVILVDNVSHDNSHKKCKEIFPQIRLIENKKNLGYCEGNNVGILASRGKYVTILNPDTEVEPNWLTELVTAYEKNGPGLYQPKVISLYENNVLQSTGNMMQLFGFGYARDKGKEDTSSSNSIEEIGYASGTCLFSSLQDFKKIGLFDPFIFLYHDDLDLGWKAAQLGINSFYVPTSRVYHAESYSLKWSSKKFYWLERNRKYCILTHFSKKTYKKIRFSLFLVDVLVWVFYFGRGFFFAKINAEINLFKNRKLILKRYRELENKKIISDQDLINKFSDEIFVPDNVANGFINKLFNLFLSKLSKRARRTILKNNKNY